MHRAQFPCRPCSILYCLVLVIALCCVACTDGGRAESDRKRPEWKTGYWFWPGWWGGGEETTDSEQAAVSIDVLYVRVGEYHTGKRYSKPEPVFMSRPGHMPRANLYVAVFRCEGSTCTDTNIIPELTKGYESLKRETGRTGLKLSGLQVDYDCPTVDLGKYGRFLKELRKALPKDDMLSITALLDWFGPKTDVSDAIRWVDEFVPQFYDVDYRRLLTPEGGIAEPIDAARWGPTLNAYQKPYRVGIASFGRIIEPDRQISREESKGFVVRGESALELSAQYNGRFEHFATSAAGETISQFRCSNGELSKIKMVIPTFQSISSAYAAAKALGGYCSGVVFFRHPVGREALALSPAEISNIVSGKGMVAETTRVEAEDGLCVPVSCSDLSVRLKDRFPPKDLTLVIRSSQDLEYFIPDRLTQARARGCRLIEVKVPAFAGMPRIPVGRAMSRDPVRFTVEEKP